jgi:large subunit ribosomal protein L6
MSRIGRLPVAIPSGVKVGMDGGVFTAQGPKGRHSERIHPDVAVEIDATEVRVSRPSEAKKHKALHGLSRTLIANSVKGVAEGFTKKLEIRGVGYKAEVKGKTLVLALGYSHPVEFPVPEGIEIQCETPTMIAVRGVSRQRVGQVAANIRGFRPPEPYKGKGIRYEGESVRQKAGKTAGK